MRKPPDKVSRHARLVMSVKQLKDDKFKNDPSWAEAEAALMQTPIGEVHLHWHSHRGRGRWTLVVRPTKVGKLCDTVRCRRVTIIPHGGENESVRLAQRAFDDVRNDWLSSRWGAYCPMPEILHSINIITGEIEAYLEPRGTIWNKQYFEDERDWNAFKKDLINAR